jgi:tetratricopeptide (TPR) repeat protein
VNKLSSFSCLSVFAVALMYFRKSIEIGIQIDDQEHLAKVYTAIGQALLTNRETEEAIKYLIQGFEIDERLNPDFSQVLAETAQPQTPLDFRLIV